MDLDGTVAVPTVTTPNDQWDEFVGWFTAAMVNEAKEEVALVNGRLPVTGNRTVFTGWGPKYAIGDVGPGGGRIFYIYVHDASDVPPRETRPNPQYGAAGTHWRYLKVETSRTTQSGWGPTSGATGGVAFADRFTTEAQDAIGAGRAAVTRIYEIFSNDSVFIESTAAFKINGDADPSNEWYLPAAQELIEIARTGVWQQVNMDDNMYWSSSSYKNATDPLYPDSSDMSNQAFAVSVNTAGDTEVHRVGRGSTQRLRAIRRF